MKTADENRSWRRALIPPVLLPAVHAAWRPLCRVCMFSLRPPFPRFLLPRLGRLRQYRPRPMTLPTSYYSLPVMNRYLKISIVTAGLHHGSFIERTLRSVLDQNYPAVEYFVRDGGSEDETKQILERYEARLAGWLSQPDRGQTPALNAGFQQTNGEILAYLNADDLLLPGSLHYIGNFFLRNPEVDAVYGHRILIDEMDNEIGRWIMPPHDDDVLPWADFVPQETLFWRRSLWERVGSRFDETFNFAMDWDLLLRFREVGARLMRLPRFIGAFRVHTAQKTATLINDVGFGEMERLRLRCHGRKVTRGEIRRATAPYLIKHLCWHFGTRVRDSLWR